MVSQNTKTDGNLKAAFAGESQANRRYLLFADKASQEGQPQIARLFRGAAASETVHARRHSEAMHETSRIAAETPASGGQPINVQSTKENLTEAIKGEHYEFTKMYPSFVKQAEEDDNVRAQMSFNRANAVEQIHHGVFESALKALEAKQPLKDESYFVCQVCGNTVAGEAPEKCPICGALHSRSTKAE